MDRSRSLAQMTLVTLLLVACGSRLERPTAAILPPTSPTSPVTPTILRTPTPSPSPTPSPTPDTASIMATSVSLRAAQEYGDDAALWDQYLAQDPNYVDGYYQRATARNWGAPGVGALEEFLRVNLAALADLDHAIAMGLAVDGRYFWRRYQVLTDFISVEPVRANREALMRLAMDNLIAANSIGPWSDVSRGVAVPALADLGRCEEAIAAGQRHLEEMVRLFPLAPWAHARAHAYLGRAYNCALRWADAVQEYDQALALDPNVDHWSWGFWRSANLYFLGRLEEAREFLDQEIEAHPYYSGERYFLRALILYDQGQLEEAVHDLQFGALQTWRPDGVYWLVRGQIEIDEGVVDAGLADLARAEASLSDEFFPLREKVARMAQEAGGSGLPAGAEYLPRPYPTTFTSLAAGTPMPVLPPTPTPRAPFEIPGLCGCDWRIFDLAQGTGPLLIRSELELGGLFSYIYRFQPPTPIRDGSAVDLTFRMLPFGELSQPDPSLQVDFYSPDSDVITGTDSWGDNRVEDLRAVGIDGEVTLVIRNTGILPVYIQNLGMRLVSQDPKGGYLIQQADGIPFMKEDPFPPPTLVVDLTEGTGAISVPPGNGPTLGFSPENPIEYARVIGLTVLVEAGDAAGELPLVVIPWSPWGNGWGRSDQVSVGEFQVQWPHLAVDLQGNIAVALMNQGADALELTDVSIRLVIEDREGIQHTIEPLP